MVEKGIVLDTIKKMYSSGLSDNVVRSTLKDIGLQEAEIKNLIAEAKGVAPTEAQPAQNTVAVPEMHEKIAAATAEKMRQQLAERSEEDALMHTTTQASIAGYETRLMEVITKLSNIEKKIGSLTGLSDFAAKAIALDKKISAIESDLSELKAISNATKSLMEKVLETDRNVLTELEEKK